MKIQFDRSEERWGKQPLVARAVASCIFFWSRSLLHQPRDACREISGRKAACSQFFPHNFSLQSCPGAHSPCILKGLGSFL